jgi:hypothetical protein
VLFLVKATNKKIDTKVSKQGDSITKQVIAVAEFTGQQVTGVTVTSTERIFVNFPRWRKGVENSVIEITKDNKKLAYPNEEWNSWEIGSAVEDQKIYCSIWWLLKTNLYVTSSPLFGAVLTHLACLISMITT